MYIPEIVVGIVIGAVATIALIIIAVLISERKKKGGKQ